MFLEFYTKPRTRPFSTLALVTNVELVVGALNTAEMKNSGIIINLQNHLKTQKRIFEATA